MESSTTAAFFLMSRDFSRLARIPVTTISSNGFDVVAVEAVAAATVASAAVVASAATTPVLAQSAGRKLAIRVNLWLAFLQRRVFLAMI